MAVGSPIRPTLLLEATDADISGFPVRWPKATKPKLQRPKYLLQVIPSSPSKSAAKATNNSPASPSSKLRQPATPSKATNNRTTPSKPSFRTPSKAISQPAKPILAPTAIRYSRCALLELQSVASEPSAAIPDQLRWPRSEPTATRAAPAAVAPVTLPAAVAEDNERRLAQRQRQIELGKATVGYQSYVAQVASDQRPPNAPRTPDKQLKTSKRSWDASVRRWRRQLHIYDPDYDVNAQKDSETSVSSDDEESSTILAP